MCLAIPGKIIEILDNGKIILKYPKEKREMDFSVIPIEIGDYVLSNSRIIVKKVSEEEAKKFWELVK